MMQDTGCMMINEKEDEGEVLGMQDGCPLVGGFSFLLSCVTLHPET